jgi:nucleoid DNA-binding protein
MDNHSTKGKSGLIRELIAKGLSVRKAEQAVNSVFDCMTHAAWRGESVEIPGGTIQAKIMNGEPRRLSQRFQDVRTRKIAVKVVTYPGRRRVVKFRPDESLDLTPLPLPVPPATPTPEQIECRRLATELLAKAVDDQVMTQLQEGADHPSPKPGALLRRLREVQNRGWRIRSTEELTKNLAKLYWM